MLLLPRTIGPQTNHKEIQQRIVTYWAGPFGVWGQLAPSLPSGQSHCWRKNSYLVRPFNANCFCPARLCFVCTDLYCLKSLREASDEPGPVFPCLGASCGHPKQCSVSINGANECAFRSSISFGSCLLRIPTSAREQWTESFRMEELL